MVLGVKKIKTILKKCFLKILIFGRGIGFVNPPCITGVTCVTGVPGVTGVTGVTGVNGRGPVLDLTGVKDIW